MDDVLQAMVDEVRRSPAIYQPSAFWQFFSQRNLEQLQEQGLQRFKATINQNYFNWLPVSFADNQLQSVLRHWAAHPSLKPLRARLERACEVETVEHKHLLADPEHAETYALFVGLLWHHATSVDTHHVLEHLTEPELGDPIRIRLGDRLISQDLANSAREFNTIVSRLSPPAPGAAVRERPIIAELGAGYGRLAHVFAASWPCRYWIFDIPPALHVAQWYLPQLFAGKRIFRFRHFDAWAEVRDEVEACDLCFFTPNQLELVPDATCEAFINISSLHEMLPEQIRHYLGLMASRTTQVVYLKQWLRSVNTWDGVTVSEESYRLPAPWQVVLNQPDLVQDQFFERVFCHHVAAEPAPDRRRPHTPAATPSTASSPIVPGSGTAAMPMVSVPAPA